MFLVHESPAPAVSRGDARAVLRKMVSDKSAIRKVWMLDLFLRAILLCVPEPKCTVLEAKTNVPCFDTCTVIVVAVRAVFFEANEVDEGEIFIFQYRVQPVRRCP